MHSLGVWIVLDLKNVLISSQSLKANKTNQPPKRKKKNEFSQMQKLQNNI